jgi:hypothetical protein
MEFIRHSFYSSFALLEILPSGLQILLYLFTLTFPYFFSFILFFYCAY